MKYFLRCVAVLFSTLVLAECAHSADIASLVKQLDSAKEAQRGSAILELRKLGDAAREQMARLEYEEKLEPRQQLLVRRLLGELQIAENPLKPVDVSALKPFGEDAAKGTKGDPDLLVDREKKIISMNGEFALEQGALEFLVVSKGPNARLHGGLGFLGPPSSG